MNTTHGEIQKSEKVQYTKCENFSDKLGVK